MVKGYDPKDGPVLKWIAAHAKPLLYEKDHRDRLDQILDDFRTARNDLRPYETCQMLIEIGTTPVVIDLSHDRGKYSVMLSFGETYLCESTDSTRPLKAVTNLQVPQTIAHGMVGSDAGDFIQLPSLVQPLIDRRPIEGVKQFEQRLILNLSPAPW